MIASFRFFRLTGQIGCFFIILPRRANINRDRRDYLKLEDDDEQVIYIYGREAIALDGEIVYDRKKRRWSVTLPSVSKEKSQN
jgi:hypothetical protein